MEQLDLLNDVVDNAVKDLGINSLTDGDLLDDLLQYQLVPNDKDKVTVHLKPKVNSDFTLEVYLKYLGKDIEFGVYENKVYRKEGLYERDDPRTLLETLQDVGIIFI